MKNMAWLALLLTLAPGCTESTGPSTPPVTAFQVPRCLAKAATAAPTDSCFLYDFQESLLVQFCAMGNCCPDSNRFSFSHRISQDTIFVVIADTAAQLCRCNCTYTLVMAFEKLVKDSYLFYCTRQDYSNQYVLYSRRVDRTR